MRDTQLHVRTSTETRFARLVRDRPRSRILAVQGGSYAKIVKDSKTVRENPRTNPAAATWLHRNRRAWEHLRHQTHPGLLRVGHRVLDGNGDEGYLCEALDVFNPSDHPHPARRSLGTFLTCVGQLAEAAGIMHDHGFVHSDITPANVCFKHGLPVLIDYEMTVRVGQSLHLFDAPDTQAVCITPTCCAPEQTICEGLTPATDVYGIALTALSWLTKWFGVQGAIEPQSELQSLGLCARGHYPHWDLVESLLTHEPLIEVFRQCMKVSPDQRIQTGTQLAQTLQEVAAQIPKQRLGEPILSPMERTNPQENGTISIQIFTHAPS